MVSVLGPGMHPQLGVQPRLGAQSHITGIAAPTTGSIEASGDCDTHPLHLFITNTTNTPSSSIYH